MVNIGEYLPRENEKQPQRHSTLSTWRGTGPHTCRMERRQVARHAENQTDLDCHRAMQCTACLARRPPHTGTFLPILARRACTACIARLVYGPL
ncbi:hypothetical protein J6590_031930 [Homalodisca vitripennis]|nr:hypothetical protein J6590_031930 [Homalodisca vitripennis]